MRETLTILGERLRELPTQISELLAKKAEAAEQIRQKTERMKEIELATALQVASEKREDGKPAFSNENMRQAEVAKRLKANAEYTFLDAEISTLKKFTLTADQELEFLTRTFKADTTILSTVSALLTVGRPEDAEALMEAYSTQKVGEEPKSSAQPEQQPEQPQQPEGKKDSDLETGIFTVLEVKTTSNGTIRAWCKNESTNEKIAIYAKNAAGKTLERSVGAKIEAKYRKLDKGLFAIAVKEVA